MAASRQPKQQRISSRAGQSAAIDFVGLRAAQLEPWLPYLYGNRFARVLALKGEPGEAEKKGQPPFFGADGEALESALAALDWGSNNWCGVVLDLPGKDVLKAGELRLLVETIDPVALLALDEKALLALQDGFGRELLPRVPRPGVRIKLLGRALVFADGFEAALASETGKRRVWQELKALRPWNSIPAG